jgi:GT2 family glycosyltransferase
MPPKVSVLIVNYKGIDHLPDCLKALRAQTFRDFEIILIDNASDDGSVEYVRKNHPEVRLFPLARNTGFTGGNIAGLKEARGEYIALLNPDTEADPDWLAELIVPMEEMPLVGICASKMIFHGTQTIDSAGDILLTSVTAYKRGTGTPVWNYPTAGPVFGACGGAALYRRQMIEEIGFFDDDFFLVHEDTDLNFRALLAGWKCAYVATAIVRHKARATIGHRSPLAIRQMSRNLEWVWIKNMPRPLMLRYLHHKIFAEVYTFLDCARDFRTIAFLKGKIGALAGLPKMLRKRREVQSLRKASIEEIDRMLTNAFSKEILKVAIKRFGSGFRVPGSGRKP